jgi:hypothetical protein
MKVVNVAKNYACEDSSRRPPDWATSDTLQQPTEQDFFGAYDAPTAQFNKGK